MTDYVFSMVCTPEIEEALLDTVLIHFSEEVFTSMPIFSHGTAPGRLSPAEQVMGRSRAVFIQILVTTAEVDTLARLLAEKFAGTGIRYWTTPVSLSGELA